MQSTTVFQSHYGLILSWRDWGGGSMSGYEDAFNPTMVWFYHAEALEQLLSALPFQSHYGLILSEWDMKTGSG